MQVLTGLFVAFLFIFLTACGDETSHGMQDAALTPSDAASPASSDEDPGEPVTTATDGTPSELIIGTWELINAAMKPTFEYSRDGVLKMQIDPEIPTRTGTYRFEDEETVVIEWDESHDPAKRVHTIKVTVTEEELTTVDQKGREDRFRRLQ